jgi:uncharacterized membrane protein YgcG
MTKAFQNRISLASIPAMTTCRHRATSWPATAPKVTPNAAALRDVSDFKQGRSRRIAAVAAQILCGFLFLCAAPAHADERILRYLSDVQVQPDSSLEITETIDVHAEHDRINHGIYRDFPTRYRGPHCAIIHVGFTFEGATLDGGPVPATTEPKTNGVRIKIGDADKFVDIGDHSYVIRYRATRELGRFKDYDELYWNATGNGWIFPIDEAAVRIRLPKAVTFGQRAAYTGPEGSTTSTAEVIEEKPGDISFRTTQPLDAYEGLTVAVAFPKGVIAEPEPGSRMAAWFADNGPPLVALLGLLGLAAYYYVAWARAGRNPRAGTVVPIFSPPDDLSPAGMRYLTKMGADNRTFAAALVDMGVKGHIRLVEEDGGWFSRKKTRIERLSSGTALPSEEQAALDRLCMPSEQIVMEQKNHATFSAAKSSLSEILKDRFEGTMFKRNYGWAIAGLFLFIAALWLACSAVVIATDGSSLWQIGVVLGCLLVTALLWLGFHDSSTGKCLLSLLGFVTLSVAAGLGMPVFGQALSSGWWLPVVLPLLALPLIISAFWWIAAPTPDGRKLLDHIAGFKQYLSIAEQERLDRMTAPQDTLEVFEKYLPYAIALGVENRWADRFAGVLAAAAAQGQQGFGWYSGSSSPWNDPGGFADSVGSSLSDTISSASTAPGSSSGSGGGGSSGGGGGGGGGGGW